MFESTLAAELARRQGTTGTIDAFNYLNKTGIIGIVGDDYVLFVEAFGSGSVNPIIPIDAIHAIVFHN
ncbi:hypothetical protein [Priestia megaterium]|jgi:hypothetical protein|uniref:hypothetical protein n=1 Tax=Priestia megaterium TaxID=1404 RepID=UPI0006F28A6B|nr:hypothetical protein [Priestia megaterium]KQU16208.1 hypothetical protein ASG61_29170 [Bacillus sp. Leaf75]USL27625.1 hypothetical protein LIT33_28730 [Priestia megaterium]USL33590.1 hypothetical protein LIT30_28645 [Priestia megaterium]WDM31657.1 hypothetical protein J8N01_01240 [Priestia megaterium]